MRTKTLNKAKLMVKIESNKHTKEIKTISVYDLRTSSYWSKERIRERGVERFINMDDLKETLN